MRSLLLLVLAVLPAAAQNVYVRVSPAVTTGIHGTNAFPTIQNALDHHPWPGPGGRVIIQIAPGVYHERLSITQNHPNITLLGMGQSPAGVVITNSLNAKQAGGTFFTETVEVDGDGFEADNVTFENSAGDTGQAVAVAVRANRVIFKHCRFLGYQDTLFADYGRQYYVDSYIEGAVDFLFGNAAAVFNHDELHVTGPGSLTAQSRTAPAQSTGYVILNSRVTSAIPAGKRQQIWLGRPWRPYSRVVFLRTWLPADVVPGGWNDWSDSRNQKTAWYAEYDDLGPGARPGDRVAWSRQLTSGAAKAFDPRVFLAGPDGWDPVAAAAKLP